MHTVNLADTQSTSETSKCSETDALKSRIAELEEYASGLQTLCRRLRETRYAFTFHIRFRPREERLMIMLLENEVVLHGDIIDLFYSGPYASISAMHTVRVHVSRIRRILAENVPGVKIESRNNVGYFLSPESRKTFVEFMNTRQDNIRVNTLYQDARESDHG